MVVRSSLLFTFSSPGICVPQSPVFLFAPNVQPIYSVNTSLASSLNRLPQPFSQPSPSTSSQPLPSISSPNLLPQPLPLTLSLNFLPQPPPSTSSLNLLLQPQFQSIVLFFSSKRAYHFRRCNCNNELIPDCSYRKCTFGNI